MNYIRVCPKCGSTKVGMSHDVVKAIMGAQSGYRCDNCENEGVFFPEIEEKNLQEFLENLRNKSKN